MHLAGFGLGLLQSTLAALLLLLGIAKIKGTLHMSGRMLGVFQVVLGAAVTGIFSQVVLIVAAIFGVALPAFGAAREIMRRDAKCDCFGVLSEQLEPWKNVYRAGMIISGCLLVFGLFAIDGTHDNERARMNGTVVGLFCAICICNFFIFVPTLVQGSDRRLSPPPRPVPFKPISLDRSILIGENEHGRQVRLDDFCDLSHPTLVVFTSQACTFCRPLKQELSAVASMDFLPFRLVVITDRDDDFDIELRAKGLSIVIDRENALRQAIGIASSPAAVTLNAGSTLVAKPPVRGVDQIKALVGITAIEHAKALNV